MYAWRTLPDVSLTRATLRLAELGFFGFAMNTCMTMPFRWGLLSRRGALDKAFFGGRLQRIAWLSVLSTGAEEWKVFVVNAGDALHGWDPDPGNAAREIKGGVSDVVGRVMTLRNENISVRVEQSTVQYEVLGPTWKTKTAWGGCAGVCRLAATRRV
jgi:hypothetical protein